MLEKFFDLFSSCDDFELLGQFFKGQVLKAFASIVRPRGSLLGLQCLSSDFSSDHPSDHLADVHAVLEGDLLKAFDDLRLDSDPDLFGLCYLLLEHHFLRHVSSLFLACLVSNHNKKED